MYLGPQMAKIRMDNPKGSIFNTGPYGKPPLKIKKMKIGLRCDLSWPKLSLAPKFHDPGTFGGFGKRKQNVTIYPVDF